MARLFLNSNKLVSSSLIAFLLFLGLASCKSKDLRTVTETNRPKIEEIDNLKDDQGNYVYLDKGGSVKVNDNIVAKNAICQALLTQQAFHWSVVLSPSKSTNEAFLQECEKEIRSCYDKYLLVIAVDMYDKAFSELNDTQKANVRELYPLHLIITAPRKG